MVMCSLTELCTINHTGDRKPSTHRTSVVAVFADYSVLRVLYIGVKHNTC